MVPGSALTPRAWGWCAIVTPTAATLTARVLSASARLCRVAGGGGGGCLWCASIGGLLMAGGGAAGGLLVSAVDGVARSAESGDQTVDAAAVESHPAGDVDAVRDLVSVAGSTPCDVERSGVGELHDLALDDVR